MGGKVTTSVRFPLGHRLDHGEHIMGIPHHLLAGARSDVADQWHRWTGITDTNNNSLGLFKASHKKDFHRFGPGVPLYFRLLYHLGILTMGLFLLSLPQLIFSISGDMMSQVSESWVLKTMLSNMGTMPMWTDGDNDVKLHALLDRPMDLPTGQTLSVKWGITISAICNVFGVVLVIAWVAIFYHKVIPKAVNAFDEATVRMSDHALVVFDIPEELHDGHDPEEYRQRLVAHFEKIAKMNSSRFKKLLKRPRLSGLGIVDNVTVVTDQNGNFGKLTGAGEQCREWALIQARKHHGQDDAKTSKQKDKCMKKLTKAMDSIVEGWTPPEERRQCMAFVTFVNAFDKDFVEWVYKPYTNRINIKHMPDRAEYLMFEQHPIRVKQAPEPEAIIWENLDIDPNQARGYTAAVWLVTILFVGLYTVSQWAISTIVIDTIPPPLTTTAIGLFGRPRNEGWSFCDIRVFSDFECTKEIQVVGTVPYWDQSQQLMTAELDLSWDNSHICRHDGYLTLPGSDLEDASKSGAIAVLATRSEVRCVQFKQSSVLDQASQNFEIDFCTEAGIGYDNDDKNSDEEPLAHVRNFACTQAGRLHVPFVDEEDDDDETRRVITVPVLKTEREIEARSDSMSVIDEIHGTLEYHYNNGPSSCKNTNIDGIHFQQLIDLATGMGLEYNPDQALVKPEEGTAYLLFNELNWYRQCTCSSNLWTSFVSGRDSCRDINENRTKEWFKTLSIGLLIHVFNFVLKKVIRAMTVLEGHYCTSNYYWAAFTKLFIANFINMAVVIWLVNIKWSTSDSPLQGNYSEFNGLWYNDIGQSMALQGLSFIFIPHVLKIFITPFKIFINRKKGTPSDLKKKGKGGCYTQYDCNRVYTAPEFKVDAKVSTSMALLGMALFYGPGVPVLYGFASAAFFIMYWCDKYGYIRSYADKSLDERIIEGACYIVPLLIALHSSMAVGFYGSTFTAPSFPIVESVGDNLLGEILSDIEQGLGGVTSVSYWSPSVRGIFDWDWNVKLSSYILSSGALLAFVIALLFGVLIVGGVVYFISAVVCQNSGSFTVGDFSMADASFEDATTLKDVASAVNKEGLINSYDINIGYPHYHAAMVISATVDRDLAKDRATTSESIIAKVMKNIDRACEELFALDAMDSRNAPYVKRDFDDVEAAAVEQQSSEDTEYYDTDEGSVKEGFVDAVECSD